MERFGKDVWSLFAEAGKSFPPATVFQLGLQMVRIYIYIFLSVAMSCLKIMLSSVIVSYQDKFLITLMIVYISTLYSMDNDNC